MKTRALKVELARRIVSGSSRLRSALSGIDQALESWVGVLLRHVLSMDEKQALTVALYDDAFNPANDFGGLYPWEERWFTRRLPAAPARILVGAAGCGREAKALERLGYSVVALEPSPRAAQRCRQTLAPSSTVIDGSYQDLIDMAFGESDAPSPLTRHDRFDAIVLGWGSFGHVLRAEERFRLLSACDALCPAGPILFSLFRAAQSTEARLDAETVPAFFAWGGFLAEPSAEELASHCNALGRELIAALDNASPYFTLVPLEPSIGARANSDPGAAER